MNIALARSRFYHLLSSVILHGITQRTLSLIQAVDELAEHLPTQFDPSTAAAEHQTLIGLNIYPFESVFLDASGMLGGALTEEVAASCARLGYRPDSAATAADHLGAALGLLAFLCGAEGDAQEDGATAIARQMQQHQRDFMEAHLLRWLWPCALAIQHEAHPFYATVAELTVEFVSSHYAELLGDSTPQTDFTLPDPPDLLADEKTGLKEICDYLATPIYSGLFLSRTAMVRLGRSQKLPSGFGNRRQTLENLFNSAAQYDEVGTLLDQLGDLYEKNKAILHKWRETEPAVEPFLEPWRLQMAQTQRIFTKMSAADV